MTAKDITHDSDTNSRPTILVVDDAPESIAMIREQLKDSYKVKAAPSGAHALRIAAADPVPDLILLDIMMPELDGFEVCRRLKADPATCDIPVIFLTSSSAEEDERLGFEIGAVDYIAKPVSQPIVTARVKTQLQLKETRDFLRNNNEFLVCEVSRRTHEVLTIQDVAMTALASLAETRDNETGNHIRRTQHYTRLLAAKLQYHPRFAGQLDANTIDLIYKSAPLHDIGKVGIPDAILLKPGKLTDEEFAVMKTHTTLGRDAIAVAENLLDSPHSFLHIGSEIVYYHHEKWDGSGYPCGLAGEQIPLSARLMALADVYDALVSKRVYKPAFSHEQAVALIVEGAGSHFDPDIVAAFVEIAEEFRQVRLRFHDEE